MGLTRLWEEKAQTQKRQFLQNTIRNFDLAVAAALKFVPKDDKDCEARALDYMFGGILDLPVMVACSWSDHSAESEETVINGIRKKFAEVRERATVRDSDGNKVEAEAANETGS